MNRIAEIEKRMHEATPRPWRLCGHDRGGCDCRQIWSIPADGIVAVAATDDETDGEGFVLAQALKNGQFIAAAPDDISYLLDQVREARELLEMPIVMPTTAETIKEYRERRIAFLARNASTAPVGEKEE